LPGQAPSRFGRCAIGLKEGVGQQKETDMTTGPAHKLRIGTLQATIWRNLADKGSWYSVKLTRDFKTDEGWRETDNLG
jgi:hypothetical protein